MMQLLKSLIFISVIGAAVSRVTTEEPRLQPKEIQEESPQQKNSQEKEVSLDVLIAELESELREGEELLKSLEEDRAVIVGDAKKEQEHDDVKRLMSNKMTYGYGKRSPFKSRGPTYGYGKRDGSQGTEKRLKTKQMTYGYGKRLGFQDKRAMKSQGMTYGFGKRESEPNLPENKIGMGLNGMSDGFGKRLPNKSLTYGYGKRSQDSQKQ